MWQRVGATRTVKKRRRFSQTRYGTASWSKERLAIARIRARNGARFIVTNPVGAPSIALPTACPPWEKLALMLGRLNAQNP